MIHVHRYTIAACDLCGVECPESRFPGGSEKVSDVALAHALELGWQRRHVPATSGRRKRMTWTVQLLCPVCFKCPPSET